MTIADETATLAPEPEQVSGRYVAMSPYGLLGAIGWTLLMLVLGVVANALVFILTLKASGIDALSLGFTGLKQLPQSTLWAPSLYGMLALQLVAIVVAAFAAGRRGYLAADVLALRIPQSWWFLLWGPLLLFAVAWTTGIVVSFVVESKPLADMQQWLPIIDSEHWWLVFLVAAIGAPLWEEVWFRGLAIPSFMRTISRHSPGSVDDPVRIDSTGIYFAAAAIVAALFAAVHFYSPAGAIAVFVLGMALSFILWRTGSLFAAIYSHAAWNFAVFSYVKWGMPYFEAVGTGQAT